MTLDALEPLPGEELRLHVWADALRHRAWIVVLVVLVVTAPVAAWSFTRPATYASSARVVLRPITGNAFSEDSGQSGQQVTVAMQTEAGLVSSPGVTQLVSQRLGRNVKAGTKSVTASVPINTQIVQITYRADSRRKAQAGAAAFAGAFLDYRAGLATATRRQQLNVLQKQSRTAAQSLKTASQRASATNPSAADSAQIQLYTNRLATLEESIATLRVTATDAGSIVTPADRPAARAGLSPILLTVAAALVGLLLGLLVAVWRERKDDRLRVDPSRPDPTGSVPVLGQVSVDGIDRVWDSWDEDDPWLEPYRGVRTRITSAGWGMSTIAVSGVSPEVGSSVTSSVTATLARLIAGSGREVVVVDADSHHPSLSDFCRVQPSPGLSDSLADVTGSPAVGSSHGVGVLPLGSSPTTVREMMSGPRGQGLRSRLVDDDGLVLIVAAPPASPDGAGVVVVGDGVVLLAEDRVSTYAELQRAAHHVRALGGQVLGVVTIARRSRRLRSQHRGGWDRRVASGTGEAAPTRAPRTGDGGSHADRSTDNDTVVVSSDQ